MVKTIKTLCEANNTTLKALERELGFGNGTIRRWDESAPSVDKLIKVANRFKVSISDILQDDGENGQKEKPRDENINEAIGPNKAAVLNEISDFTPEELALLRANIKKIKESRI